MKQLLQSLQDGSTRVEEVPAPKPGRNDLLIHTTTTLISAGTERMLAEFGKAGWISKARSQPDKVRMVLDKSRTDGVAATLDAVRSKLDQPLALGYCNVGRVAELGLGVEGFEAGDRIVSNGKHAEVVVVPRNLCAKVPDGVSDEAASFTVLAAIGLQGLRLAAPTLGECVAVTGLGLVGLLTVQLLRAQGCRVLGIDLDPSRLELARRFGAETVNPAAGEDVLAAAKAFSRGKGMDAVIITASAKSNEPVSQAARMCRQRGRVVLVGVVGLELNRSDFYEKELTFQVSCSYGPGRHDPSYEEKGNDYPIGFVRWTEQRNFEAVLDLMASGKLELEPLISHRFRIEEGEVAMALLTSDENSLGILLNYSTQGQSDRLSRTSIALAHAPVAAVAGKGSVAFLGAGNYAGRVLIPAFKAAGAILHSVVSGGGVSAVHYGRKFGFAEAASHSATVLANPSVDAVVIATRHNAHAQQVEAALRAGKHVFCEKPLCLTLDELDAIMAAAADHPDLHLMVGFNRRFAPHVIKMKELLAPIAEPKSFIMTVNAGEVPRDHWIQDPEVGGGRIIGEACHFIDLLRHLAGKPITAHHGVALGKHRGTAVNDDNALITLSFEDGSVGVINYLANGHKALPKERLEVFTAGRVLKLDNFLSLKAYGWSNVKPMKAWKQDKGQVACSKAFIEAVRGANPAPVPAADLFEVSRVSIEVAESLSN